MNLLLSVYIILMATVGAAVTSFKLCIYLGVPEVFAFTAATILATFTLTMSFYWVIEIPRDDAKSTAVAMWESFMVFCLTRTKRCRRIRSDIRVFLSDKDPRSDRIHYPYYSKNSTHLALAIEKIWNQEIRSRIDELLLLSDINPIQKD